MARWETDGRGRLERAALELFLEQGYERTTVAQTAQRAGLTERSFYRHYADKREVLFGGGSNERESHLVASVDAVPAELEPLEVILTALVAAHALFRPREFLLQGAAVIAANAPLRERQLIKMASMSAALVAALMRRGVDKPTAQLATDMGVSVSPGIGVPGIGVKEVERLNPAPLEEGRRTEGNEPKNPPVSTEPLPRGTPRRRHGTAHAVLSAPVAWRHAPVAAGCV